jgi:hypothetical protein
LKPVNIERYVDSWMDNAKKTTVKRKKTDMFRIKHYAKKAYGGMNV